MNDTYIAEAPAERIARNCELMRGDFLTELGRVYLQAGLPLAAAVQAALADCEIFDLPCGCES